MGLFKSLPETKASNMTHVKSRWGVYLYYICLIPAIGFAVLFMASDQDYAMAIQALMFFGFPVWLVRAIYRWLARKLGRTNTKTPKKTDKTAPEAAKEINIQFQAIRPKNKALDIDPTGVDFFTFDFETANEDNASICQIGVSIVRAGVVVETHAIDVNPKSYFLAQNIEIHGITPKRVENSPEFAEAIAPFTELFRNTIAVSHSSFDKHAIAGACKIADLQNPLDQWFDSMNVVRRTWPEHFAKKGYGLANLSKHFDIPFGHHDAGEDARITAEVVILAIGHSNISAHDWLTESKKPKKSRMYASKQVKVDGNQNGPLFGQIAVFTGELTISRSDAAKLAGEAGITVGASVTKKTTLLVVGDQDLNILAGHTKSSKHRKAEEYIEKGQDIRIIGQTDFLKLIANN